jgi:hypothetical protein
MMSLLRVLAKAEEFSSIQLRRSEKKVLNDINHRKGEGAIKYRVLADGAGGAIAKVKERICKPAEKTFLLVSACTVLCAKPRSTAQACSYLSGDHGMGCPLRRATGMMAHTSTCAGSCAAQRFTVGSALAWQ